MTLATAVEMSMPKLSDSMEQGTIIAWLLESGAQVSAGDDLLEVETDKANMTVQAQATGVLEILAQEGSTLAVGAPIARFHGEGVPVSPPGEREAAPSSPSAPFEPATAEHIHGLATHEPQGSANGSARATPLARRIAATHGVDLASLRGSGFGGRITKADVRAAAGLAAAPSVAATHSVAPAPRAAPAMPAPLAGADGAKGEVEIQELTRLQAVVARRMAEAKAMVPHFQVQTEVRMDAAIELRVKLKQLAGEEPAPSFNDLIVRAAALALRRHPKANGSYRDGRFELHGRINVGIAVAAEDALVVPTIFDADSKSLGEIARESRRLAERVRSGTVTPPELAGGTFTVSNLGMFGMTAINPVINLPQAAILGVGMTRHLLLRGNDGEIEDASIMNLTLSCDHRILYGAEAALFLGTIRDLLESPLRAAL
jgi:pyruvate dehydrogenase E2 component (dihydrolipoyllysine-residue acetyltransferase)